MIRHGWHIAVALAAATALALWNTGFHVVPAAGASWRGLTDAPGLTRLALSLAAGILLALLVARRTLTERRPLAWLALAAAPLVPVASGHFLLGLALQRPGISLVAAAALGVALVRRHSGRAWREPHPLALFVAALSFYAALGTRLPGPAGPQGDEPHYLTMAQSLASDGDLDLRDEFEHREYASFFAGTLRPHTSPASPPGELRTVHAPGLPLLILPAYLLGGYPGVRLFLSALAALTGVLVFRLVSETSESPGLAWAAWGVLTFTPPLPFYAVAVYPETPAALATAVFLVSGRRRSPSKSWLAGASLVAAALPWIHPKLLPLTAVGLGLTLARDNSRRARALAVGGVGLSLLLLLGYFHVTYGQASFSAAYGPGFAGDVSLWRAPWGAAALILDRQFGLLSISPIWALVLPGFVVLTRRRGGDALRVALLAGATFGIGASFSMWWGGSCPPARFVVPALPALALALAPALRARRDLAAALAGVGVAIVAFAAEAPRAIHNRANGNSGLLRFLATDLDLDGSFPSFVLEDDRAPLLAASLLAVMALTWLRGGRGFLLGALGYVALAGGLRGRPLVSARGATQHLLQAWDDRNVLEASGPLELATLSIPMDLRSAPWLLEPGEARSSRRLDLPPGQYRAEVTSRALGVPDGARVGRVTLSAGSLLLGSASLVKGQPGSLEVTLPTGARRLWVTIVGVEGRLRVEAVRLVPEALVPRGLRKRLAWPRSPDQARYRVGAGSVRASAQDRSIPEGEGFRLDGAEGRFAVEVPVGSQLVLQMERPRPSLGDRLDWGDTRIDLRGAPSRVSWTLDPESGIRLGSLWTVPVLLRSQGAWIAFTEVD